MHGWYLGSSPDWAHNNILSCLISRVQSSPTPHFTLLLVLYQTKRASLFINFLSPFSFQLPLKLRQTLLKLKTWGETGDCLFAKILQDDQVNYSGVNLEEQGFRSQASASQESVSDFTSQTLVVWLMPLSQLPVCS